MTPQPIAPQLSVSPAQGHARNPLLSGSGQKHRHRETPLEAFVNKLDGIKQGPLRDLEFILRDAKDLHDKALRATTAKAERESVAKAESFAQRASATAAKTCQALQGLAAESRLGAPGSSEAALRRQSFAGATVLFQRTLSAYFQAQTIFKEQMQAKMSRQLRAAFPDADKLTVDAVAAGQASAASAIQATVRLQAGTGPLSSATALQATRELDELASLDRAAMQLAKAFQDVETMVNAQQEVFDDIARHLSTTRDQVQLATEHLRLASASRMACRYRWCWLTVILVIALIVILVLTFRN